jgi:pullulanase/glycogen debranching enzyme
MLLIGDEYGHTNQGNNNLWCHDSPSWFQWNALEKYSEFHRFYRLMIYFRKHQSFFHRREFLTSQEVDWHGHLPFKPDWSGKSRFVAYTLKDALKEACLYIAFNAESIRPSVQLPDPPTHKKWYRVVDTALKSPFDFIEEPQKYPPIKTSYKMEAYSVLIATAL